MEDVTRKRVMRVLERLPEEQLYQVLDYIEFLELKYARAASRKPDVFQEFAERVEDQLRVRSLAPRAMKGTMRIMSTAGRVLDGVKDLGKGLTPSSPSGSGGRESGAEARGAREAPDGPGSRRGEESGDVGEGRPERDDGGPSASP